MCTEERGSPLDRPALTQGRPLASQAHVAWRGLASTKKSRSRPRLERSATPSRVGAKLKVGGKLGFVENVDPGSMEEVARASLIAVGKDDAGKDRESKQDCGAAEDHGVIGPPARHALAVVGHSHITHPAGYRVRPPKGWEGDKPDVQSTPQAGRSSGAGAIWRLEAMGVGSALRLREGRRIGNPILGDSAPPRRNVTGLFIKENENEMLTKKSSRPRQCRLPARHTQGETEGAHALA